MQRIERETPRARFLTDQRALTHPWRRAGVVAAYGGYAAFVAVFWLSRQFDGPARHWIFALTIPTALVLLAGFVGLLASWVWIAANSPDAALDERQQRVRDRAYLHGYQALGATIVFGGIYALLAWDTRAKLGLWLPRTWNETQAVFWGLFLLALTLPTAIIAWTEPDLPADED